MKGTMAPRSHSTIGTGVDSQALGFAIAVSALGHIVFFAAMILFPDLKPNKKMSPSVINVTMVAMPSPGMPASADAPVGLKTEPPQPPAKPAKDPVPVLREKPREKKPRASETVSLKPDKKKSKPKPKLKRSLKKKTFKPGNVVKRAIDRIEKQVEDSKTDPLQEAFSRLKETVAKQTPRKTDKPAQPAGGSGQPGGVGLPGGSGAAGGRAVEIIDIYRVEIALQIQQNWAFSDQLAGSAAEAQASLVFKVMPSGEIRDVFFTDRSGNRYLDESAYRAVMKTNPVKPHPQGIVVPFVQVGLRFTPEGIR